MQELIGTLEREAEARSAAILEEARESAARVIEEGEREIERRIEAEVEAREERWRREAGARVARARREAEERALAAREELLRKVFARAAKRLGDLPDSPRYARAAPRLLERALSFLPAGGSQVVCDPATARAVTEVAARAGARIEARHDAAPGIVARSAAGSVSVDATLATLLDRLRPTFAMDVAARVEEGA
jgi:vacuolar-type H+-ATPase subunit E/Vma4